MHYCRKKGQKIKRKHLFPNRNVGESNARLFYSSKLSLSNQWVTMTSFASWHTKTHNLKYFFTASFFFFFSPHHMRVVPVKFKTTWKNLLSQVFFWDFWGRKFWTIQGTCVHTRAAAGRKPNRFWATLHLWNVQAGRSFVFALSLSLSQVFFGIRSLSGMLSLVALSSSGSRS